MNQHTPPDRHPEQPGGPNSKRGMSAKASGKANPQNTPEESVDLQDLGHNLLSTLGVRARRSHASGAPDSGDGAWRPSPNLQHPSLRLLMYERQANVGPATLALMDAINENLSIHERCDAIMRFASINKVRECEIQDPLGITIEVLENLIEQSLDPRLPEELDKLGTQLGIGFSARSSAHSQNSPGIRHPVLEWVEKLAQSQLLMNSFANNRIYWNCEQAASAIRLFRRWVDIRIDPSALASLGAHLNSEAMPGARRALAAANRASGVNIAGAGNEAQRRQALSQTMSELGEWVFPLWDMLLAVHTQKIQEWWPQDFQTTYSKHAQRLLWNRINTLHEHGSSAARPTPAQGSLGASAPGSAHPTSQVSEASTAMPMSASAGATGSTSAAIPKPGTHVVIHGVIPPSQDKVDREVLLQYEQLRMPIDVAELPSKERIEHIALELQSEFPWATESIALVIREALGRKLYGARDLGMPSLLLVGEPGCGKSRLVRRIAECFSIPFVPMSLAGIADPKMLTGTSRGWAAGQPSPIVTTLLQNQQANPLVLIDEIDKAPTGSSPTGPAPLSVLLSLLEKENARQWRDLFLQTPCDLSRVMWMATANSIKSIPTALMSRFIVVHVPQPDAQQMRSVLPFVAADIEAEWGLPRGHLPDVPDSVITDQALKQGMNMRDIARAVRDYLQSWAIDNLADKQRH